MLYEVDLHLAKQIAAIEARGTGHLRAIDRLAAQRMALAAALPAALVVPALAFALGWFVPLRWTAVLAAALLVPIACFALLFVRCRRRQQRRTRDAMQLFDRQLGLKDRIVTADEFMHAPERSAFMLAALEEAETWVDVAATAELTGPEQPRGAWGRWPFALAGLALLGATAAQQRFFVSGNGGGAIAEALARIGVAAPGTPPATVQAVGMTGSAARRPASLAAAADPSQGASADQRSTDAMGRSNGAGTRRAGGGNTPPAGGFDTPGASQSESAASAPAGNAASAASRGQGSGPAQASGAQQGRSGAADKAGGDRAPSDSQATRPSGSTQQSAAAAGAQSPAASPLGSQRPPSGKSGNGNQPPPQSRSQQNNSDHSQPGQGNGQGRNGQKDGQDALKRSNGVAALLLAVPMADRLGGTPNPGLVSSQPRQVPPHAGVSGAVAAGNRGIGNGDSGHLPHRPATPQERRLVRDYFRSSGAPQ